MPNPRRTPGALATGLMQNAQAANQMGNIYAGSRMTSSPTGQMFISGRPKQQMPQSQADFIAQKHAAAQARRVESDKKIAAYKAANPDPWGEGKKYATRQEFVAAMQKSFPDARFTWSGEFENTPEAVQFRIDQENDALRKKYAGDPFYRNYQTPEVVTLAIQDWQKKRGINVSNDEKGFFSEIPGLEGMSKWASTPGGYEAHGYELVDNPYAKEFGMDAKQWQKIGQPRSWDNPEYTTATNPDETSYWKAVMARNAAVSQAMTQGSPESANEQVGKILATPLNNYSVVQTAPKVSQQPMPQTTQAQSPAGTQESAVQPQQAQSPALATQASYSPQQAANALTQQQAIAQAFGGLGQAAPAQTGKGGQVLPNAGKGGKQLPKP